MTKRSPFKYFKTSPQIIRLAVIMYVRYPLSLRNVEDLLHERGVDMCRETVRFWWNRFGPMFAEEIRKRRVEGKCAGVVQGFRTSQPRPIAVGNRPAGPSGLRFQMGRLKSLCAQRQAA